MINTTCIVPVWEEADSSSEYAPPYINVKDSEMIVESQGALKDGGIYDGIIVTIRCLVSAEDLINAVEKCRRDRPRYLQIIECGGRQSKKRNRYAFKDQDKEK